MADIRDSCTGKCYPKKEGKVWVCMYCHQPTPDPNEEEKLKKYLTSDMKSICETCIFKCFEVRQQHFFCGRKQVYPKPLGGSCDFYKIQHHA